MAWSVSCVYLKIANCICKRKIIKEILLTLMFVVVIHICDRLMPDIFNGWLSFSFLSYLLPYILTGIIISRYHLFDYIFKNECLYDIVLSILTVLLILFYVFHHGRIKIVIAPFAIYVVTYLFYNYKDKRNKVKTWLSYCGRSSMSIYLFHYFFIHSCYCCFFASGEMGFVELLVAVIISIIICTCCLVLEQLIRTSKVLQYLLIGR